MTGRQGASCAAPLPGVPYFPTMTLARDVLAPSDLLDRMTTFMREDVLPSDPAYLGRTPALPIAHGTR